MAAQAFRVMADGALIARHVIAATRFAQRLRGLIGHCPLEDGAGLLLDPGGSVHTVGMGFAIDVVFLDRNRCVLDTRSNVMPNRLCLAPRRTHSTLELGAGACSDRQLRPGDRLVFEATSDA